jgi:hypothetical protein
MQSEYSKLQKEVPARSTQSKIKRVWCTGASVGVVDREEQCVKRGDTSEEFFVCSGNDNNNKRKARTSKWKAQCGIYRLRAHFTSNHASN